MRRGIASAAVGVALLAAFAPSAGAVDIIEAQSGAAADGWQAGTCNLGTDLTCSPSSSGQFFTQAAGHPPVGFTQIWVKHGAPSETPVGDLKTVLVDLPPGLSVNPQAAPQCELENGKFPSGGCPPASKVGVSSVTVEALLGVPLGPVSFPVYNVAPRPGEPARFGFALDLSGIGLLNLGEVFLNAGVNWDANYHEYFTIHVPPVPGGLFHILKNRLVFDGTTESQPGAGKFLTTPSTCDNPAVEPFKAQYTTFLHADSEQEQAPDDNYDVASPAPPPASFLAGSQAVAAPLPNGVKPEGCNNVPFKPSTSVDPGTSQTDSPAGASIDVKVPFEPAAAIYNSNVREAQVTLPLGMGVNPSAAPSLQACSDAQLGKGTRNPVACPEASKIGTVAIDTPPLPDGTLTGSVYLGQQLSRDPTSGNEYRIFLDAESPARGISVRLVANVSANPATGQLSAVVHESPQVPFDLVRVTLNGGDKATLTSPPTCGPNASSHSMVAWSGTPDTGAADKGFTLTNAPGGGACAKTMAERPFAPGFAASPKSNQALAYTPFSAHLSRPQGQQELKGVDIKLPPGATAKLAGVPYCPPSDIADAATRAGAAEKKNPSCPKESHVGTATVQAGTGSSPLEIEGDVYLAGHYKGAPLSLAVVTPALAGPFDLGTVVVRVALFLDPETAQIHPVAEIPDVFGGAKLDIRSVFVNVNRRKFTLNGTNCRKNATAGVLNGGGADPTNPAAFSAFPVSDPVQGSGCEKLKFRPKLKLRLFGATHRDQHPRLRSALVTRAGDANVARASVALPHAIFLDQSSLSKICTRVQFAARECPKKSVYGHARAFSPLLAKPLEGPVYLRSSNNLLPDMVAHLEGQVDVDLVGRIDSYRGGIRTTFDRVPDVPVTKFVLTLPGGKHGLLVASESLCKPVRAIVQLKGQNGKKANRRTKVRTPCNGRKGKSRHRKGAKK